MHTAFLLNKIEASDAQEKSKIKETVEKCEVREVKELTKQGNMRTKLDEDSKPVSMIKLFREETA